MQESEIDNMRSMFLDTLNDLLAEKKKYQKYQTKLNKLNCKINLYLEKIGYFGIILNNGEYEIKPGEKLDGAKLEINATFENFFKYSSRELGDIKAILTGKLKIKGKRHLFLLLKVGNMLKVIPEKEFKKLSS
ncbi:MAG: SCP2 sterol-binding domain-containing protein [Candidatus Helarchaeota archaeon]